jgi:hypothetical protein
METGPRTLKGAAIMTFNRNLATALATLCLLAPCASGGVVNHALDKPATASSLYSDGGTYAIEFGNDGLLNTLWNGGTWAAWWQVDLQASYAIDSISVFGTDSPGLHVTFDLSSSTDGSVWAPIGLRTTGSGATWTFTFPTAGEQMRYVRFATLGDSGSDWAGLTELQANGSDSGTGGGQAPEPASLILVCAGLAAVGLRRRFRHQ